MGAGASRVWGNLYVLIASVVWLVVVGLLILSYLPAYTDRTWWIASSVVAGACYAIFVIPLLYAISRLAKVVAGRGWGLPITMVHAGALLLGAALGAISASVQRTIDRRSWGIDPVGVDREAITDTTYILSGMGTTLITYQILIAAGLGFLAVIARLRRPRTAVWPSSDAPDTVTAVPSPGWAPYARAPSPQQRRSWRLQRDSVAANIGIVTGVAGLGLGFNGNHRNAAVSLGLGVVALALVYLASRRQAPLS